MKTLSHLFEKNQNWANGIKNAQPDFFTDLAKQQTPEYLWIGCADSRVPANEIVGLKPGELFVHRNIANLVVYSDLNCLSVLQYAIEVLKVKHVIVCGHYGCGGVRAAMANHRNGLIDNWLRHIKQNYHKNQGKFSELTDEDQKVNLMCELNVKEQVETVSRTAIVQEAWSRGQDLSIHGWIYSIQDGILKDMDVTIDSASEVHEIYRVEK